MRIKKCLDDIKEQLGTRFYKKIEEEFQPIVKGWFKISKGHVSFVELLNKINEEAVSLEIKENIYQVTDSYL
jgi:hypothetical protein